MLILALESSAKPVSVAVYRISDAAQEGKLLGQSFQNNGFSHSRTLLAMTESLLSNLEIKPADIDLIAVAKGPGSFTGVRIGVSAAKGLAWGLDVQVCGVSTLEAMAYQTEEKGVLICPVMDARREQVYNALFEWRDGNLIRLCEDRAISIEELAEDLKSYDKPPLFVGDGVDVCKQNESFSDSSAAPELTSCRESPESPHTCEAPEQPHRNESPKPPRCRNAPELIRYQTAYGVALAAMHEKPIPAVDLEPSYLRPSQAERERNTTKCT